MRTAVITGGAGGIGAIATSRRLRPSRSGSATRRRPVPLTYRVRMT